MENRILEKGDILQNMHAEYTTFIVLLEVPAKEKQYTEVIRLSSYNGYKPEIAKYYSAYLRHDKWHFPVIGHLDLREIGSMILSQIPAELQKEYTISKIPAELQKERTTDETNESAEEVPNKNVHGNSSKKMTSL